MTTYSVFVYNRSTEEKELLIDGLTLDQATAHAVRVERIFPSGFVAGHVSQGFDITVEPEPEEDVTGISTRRRVEGLLIDLRHFWEMSASYGLRAQKATNDLTYNESIRRCREYRTMAENTRLALLALIPAERSSDDQMLRSE